ncbi:natural cytotoxicity triggering receptor 3 ligand 1-like [Ochotona curzoniae]|uniref:natural cytotoxicity triggering receptor 3 ligand 1-like n=1 Tax=Ochotona curzoniae TaxID=130825 RepID=UPI001B34C758|nr:natural cytotoxicity triggering receptor 3 ligand 1-like [Ochotona curzoniae]
MNLRKTEMARRSGGLSPWRFWCLFPVLWGALQAAGFRVEMAGRTQTVFLNDNITITCKIPGSPALDISTVGVVWFVRKKGSEEKVPLFEYYGDHEKAYRTGANISPEKLMRGEASLHLPAIQLSDAGEYFCKVVVTPEMDEKSVQLEVVDPVKNNSYVIVLPIVAVLILAIIIVVYCIQKWYKQKKQTSTSMTKIYEAVDQI